MVLFLPIYLSHSFSPFLIYRVSQNNVYTHFYSLLLLTYFSFPFRFNTEIIMAARLSFEQIKFILECYWKFVNAVEGQIHFRREFQTSLELEINLKQMDAFRMFTISISEDNRHRQAPQGTKEY